MTFVRPTFETAHQSPLVSLPPEKRSMAAALLSRIRNGARSIRLHATRVTPGRWFLILLAVLLLGFALALLFQPTIGRGGR